MLNYIININAIKEVQLYKSKTTAGGELK